MLISGRNTTELDERRWLCGWCHGEPGGSDQPSTYSQCRDDSMVSDGNGTSFQANEDSTSLRAVFALRLGCFIVSL